MQITPLIWIITIAVTIAFFVYEFFAHVRKPHEPTIGESARWSAFYIGLALLFGVGIGVVSGWTFGGEYFAGYLTEKALSIDNLFVFLIVMTGFAVPKIYQQKVLMIGIVIALIMRGGFIAVGADADRELLVDLLPLRRAAARSWPTARRSQPRRVRPGQRQVHAASCAASCRSPTSTTTTSSP